MINIKFIYYKFFNDIRPELFNYDINIVIKYWIQGKSFFEERYKWKNSFNEN